MLNLTEAQIEKMWLLLRIKGVILGIAFFLLLFENIVNVRGFFDLIPGYLALAVAGANGLVIYWLLKKNIRSSVLVFSSFLIDASIIILGIYLHGGLENPWTFVLVLVTFMGAYGFGISIGLVYASYSFFVLLLMFLLEFKKVIPHFPIYGIPNLYWADVNYFTDVLAGIFLLHFTLAVAVGSLSKLTDQRNEKIEEMASKLQSLRESVRTSEEETERAQKMVNNEISDVDRQLKIIEDREKEITETRSEIERLSREGGR